MLSKMANDKLSASADFLRMEGRPRVVSLSSLGVFVVTGAIWLVAHLNRWPGGYLPWMISLGCTLAAMSAFLRFREMWEQRNVAEAKLRDTFDSLLYRLKLTLLAASPYANYTNSQGITRSGYGFALTFTNGSLEVIEWELESVLITLGDKVADDTEAPSNGSFILPGAQETFTTSFVEGDLNDPPEGRCEYRVIYSHPSATRKIRLTGALKIIWVDQRADFRVLGRTLCEFVEAT